MPKHNKLLGAQGEELATQFLIQLGYTIIERNWRTRYGEIDIIAKKSNILYCIEVKTRTTLSNGYPIEAITPKKLRRMQFTAKLYANNHQVVTPIRLLVITVINGECSPYEVD